LLDDAHWGVESLDWVLEMVQRPSNQDRRMVFLVTVRDEWVSAEAVEQRLRTLAAHPRGRTVQLGPLEPGPFHELLRNLLGLDAMAAAQVSERAAGNPRFAVDLVSAWGARGLLSVGPHGFELPVGVDTKLPEGPLEIWLEQTRSALEGLPDQAWEQLERAAVLGARVERDAWNASCEGDPRVRLAIEEELIAAGLAVGTGEGWRFVQGMLREGLLASADGEGRLREHHLACAETLIARDRPSDSERIGRHLLQAGDLDGAIDRLLQGAESRGDQYRALDVLALAQDAMHRAELPAEDRRWGQAWCRRASLCMRVGRYDEAASWAQRAFAAATEMDWPKVRAHAAFERAVVALHQHRTDGEALADVALETARVTRNGWFVARAEYVRAGAAMDRRDWEQAGLRYETALQGFRVAEDFPGAADCLRDMGSVALLHGDLEVASARYLEALPLFRSHGAILGEAHVLNGLAEVARKQGDLVGAETGYRDALRRFERVGAGHAVLARLNLGLVLVHQARWPEARETLEGARSWLEQQGRDPWTAAACAVLMPVYAGIGDWVEFDRTAGRAAALLEATGFAQPDIRWAAERASQLAVQAGDAPRAAVAEGIVAMQEARLAGVEG